MLLLSPQKQAFRKKCRLCVFFIYLFSFLVIEIVIFIRTEWGSFLVIEIVNTPVDTHPIIHSPHGLLTSPHLTSPHLTVYSPFTHPHQAEMKRLREEMQAEVQVASTLILDNLENLENLENLSS